MLVKDYIYQIYSRWVKANQYWAICRRCDKQAFNSALWHYINNNKHDQLLDVFWKELHSEMVLIFKPIFINFLIEYDVYRRFQKNFKRKHQIEWRTNSGRFNDVAENLDVYLAHSKFLSYIDYAFSWGKTREGHDFWERIDSRWRQRMKEILLNDIELNQLINTEKVHPLKKWWNQIVNFLLKPSKKTHVL